LLCWVCDLVRPPLGLAKNGEAKGAPRKQPQFRRKASKQAIAQEA